MKKKAIISLVLVAMLAFGIGAGSFAWFTSQATSADNVFEAGTLKIGVPNEGENTAFITASNWAPNDSITQDLVVKNIGSLAYKYKVSASKTAGDDLFYNVLDVVITKGGTEIYNGKLSGLTDKVVSTDVASGVDETLTFKVAFPSTAGNAYQGLGATIKFVFDATQTTNPGWAE
ncbi:TasA family protein [Lutispora saccharofermentans]|uniref:CalY family protein n=1 Tax=Lutispora saccharofermentans TaxID=3024236 RepID=A0ABT1NBK7_9FIRM|nr:TasA family protein [Lutispora saccharofermentans]MCQ1528644.1 CalY family protein [Lutispora saccharofermentans]